MVGLLATVLLVFVYMGKIFTLSSFLKNNTPVSLTIYFFCQFKPTIESL